MCRTEGSRPRFRKGALPASSVWLVLRRHAVVRAEEPDVVLQHVAAEVGAVVLAIHRGAWVTKDASVPELVKLVSSAFCSTADSPCTSP